MIHNNTANSIYHIATLNYHCLKIFVVVIKSKFNVFCVVGTTSD